MSAQAEASNAAEVAKGLRAAAEVCTVDQPALQARLLVAASTIDRLCSLLLQAIARKEASRYGRR